MNLLDLVDVLEYAKEQVESSNGDIEVIKHSASQLESINEMLNEAKELKIRFDEHGDADIWTYQFYFMSAIDLDYLCDNELYDFYGELCRCLRVTFIEVDLFRQAVRATAHNSCNLSGYATWTDEMLGFAHSLIYDNWQENEANGEHDIKGHMKGKFVTPEEELKLSCYNAQNAIKAKTHDYTPEEELRLSNAQNAIRARNEKSE